MARLKGTINQLESWPSNLLLTFLSGCLIMGCLLLAFTAVSLGFFFLRIAPSDTFWIEGKFEQEKGVNYQVPNVYFVKHENRIWSFLELCHIESLARKYSNLDVYMVNLVKKEGAPKRFAASFCPEEQLRLKIASRNDNIQDIDVSIEKFFKGSALSLVARNLSDRALEMVAGTLLLWNSPGVVLQPNTSFAFNHLRHFLCHDSAKRGNCTTEKRAMVAPEIHLQATGVPCQTFMGFIIKEISKNGTSSRGDYTLKDALNTFCPKSHCSEVKILDANAIARPIGDILHCPNVHATQYH